MGRTISAPSSRRPLSAQRSILIVGWDVNSRIALEYPDHAMAGIPNRLGPFLDYLLKRSRELRIHVLNWDSPLLYKLDREFVSAPAARLADPQTGLLCPR